MQKSGLKQTDLAEVLGASLSRVKAITSGRVKNLTREESEALIGKLGVRAEWLVTGEGAMLEDDESQEQFVDRMQAINRMNALIAAMPLRALTKMRLSALMTGDPAEDGPLIAQALSAEALEVDFVTGKKLESDAPSSVTTSADALVQEVSAGDRVLLANFHAAPEQVQVGVKTTLSAFADRPASKRGKAA